MLNQVLFKDKSHKSLVIAKRERRIREGLGSQDCYAGGVIVSLYLLNKVRASATRKECFVPS